MTFFKDLTPCSRTYELCSQGEKTYKIKTNKHLTLLQKLSTPGLSQTVKMLKEKGVRLSDGQAKDHFSDVSAVIGADSMAKFIRGTCRMEGVNLFNSTGGYIIFGPLP